MVKIDGKRAQPGIVVFDVDMPGEHQPGTRSFTFWRNVDGGQATVRVLAKVSDAEDELVLGPWTMTVERFQR